MVVDHGCFEDLGDRGVGRCGLVEQLGGPVHVVRAHHDVDVLGLRRDEVAILLGEAARHDDLAALPGVLPRLQMAEIAVQLVVGVLPDAARVEHHDVGVVLRLGPHHPVGLEQPGDAFGVVLVHLAPVGAQHIATSGPGCHPVTIPARGVSPGDGFGGVSTMMMTMTPSDTELYRAHADELTRYATVLVGPDDAPDVVTDAVLAAFGSSGWRDVEHPKAYLYRAVLNTAKSRYRSGGRRRRRDHLYSVQPNPVPQPQTAVDQAVDVRRALSVLSTQQRAVVYLTYWEDQRPSDIATTLDVREGTVRKQLARARAQLRKVIDDA